MMSPRLFPISPNSKIPPRQLEWTTYQRRPPTDQERTVWKQAHPLCNWGMVTGAPSGVVVLDVDVRHGGDQSIRGLAIPRTWTVRTPSGGSHYYFACPASGCPTRLSLLPGVDLKGDGGYVLVPPSTIDGRPYEVTEHTPAATMPAWLHERTNQRHLAGAGKWRKAQGKVSIGAQNVHLISLAGKLLHHLPEELWESQLSTLWAIARQYDTDPSRGRWTLEDVRRIWQSAVRMEKARRNGSEPPADGTGRHSGTYGISDVEAAVRKWLLLPDLRVVRLLAAIIAVNLLESDPLWMFLISPPSGGKTELLNALSGIPSVYRLSELTPQTLLSGFREDKAASLLPKLTGKVVVFKDFTTVLTMHREARQAVLAQLREVYDGSVTKAFGTGKTIEWAGKIGFVAGVTEIIDTHYSVYQVLGERFVQYRLPLAEPKALAGFAIRQRGQEPLMRQELRDAFAAFFNNRHLPPIDSITLPEVLQDELASLSSFVVRARSGIIRDTFSTREIEYVPEPEAPARLAKQLATLATALAIVDGQELVSDAQMPLVTKVALDCLLKHRLRVLLALLELDAEPTTSAIAEAIDYPTNTTRRILEDLTALAVLSRKKPGPGLADRWHLTDASEAILRAALTRVSVALPETSDLYSNNSHSHYDD